MVMFSFDVLQHQFRVCHVAKIYDIMKHLRGRFVFFSIELLTSLIYRPPLRTKLNLNDMC
jgi:hypothetical protein